MQQSLNCGNRTLSIDTPAVMGILNVTPDSFSDGGKFFARDAALTQVQKMVEEGVAIIDVGGESTRPGARTVGANEELDRVAAVIETVCNEYDVVVSVDTSKPEVMAGAVAAGAGIINDVRALQLPDALSTAAKLDVPVCLMHMQGEPANMQDNPDYDNVVDEVTDFLRTRMQACIEAGIAPDNVLVDPGFGFGKNLSHNLQLLNSLDKFSVLDVPVLVGISRKSVIGQVLNVPMEQRLPGSLASAVIAAMKGAKIIRVHDVRATVEVIKMVVAVAGAEEPRVNIL